MSLYGVGVTLVDGMLGVATRRTHRGLAHLPAQGPAVIVSNHISISDPLILASAVRRAGRRVTFLAKAEVFSWPVVGWLVRLTGQIPVRAAASGQVPTGAALEPATEALRAGWLVALYPEGKVTTDPDYLPLRKARTGAVRLALAAGCPIIPVAQWGAHELVTREHRSTLTRAPRLLGWLRRGRRPRRPEVTVLVGEPITPAELRAAGDAAAATELVMARIRAQLAQIAPARSAS